MLCMSHNDIQEKSKNPELYSDGNNNSVRKKTYRTLETHFLDYNIK